MKYHFFTRSFLGQWTMASMVDRAGITYNCCEQYMMYQKALLFDDSITAAKILKELDPKKQKELGREVEGYDDDIWKEFRFQVVWEANYLKFTQNPKLLKKLLATEDEHLVEAAPWDKIWGIGMAANDPGVSDPKNWKGLNLLGKALMSVREAIKEEKGL